MWIHMIVDHTHAHTRTSTYTSTDTPTHTYTQDFIHTHTHMYVHTQTYVDTYTSTYAHTHTNILTRLHANSPTHKTLKWKGMRAERREDGSAITSYHQLSPALATYYYQACIYHSGISVTHKPEQYYRNITDILRSIAELLPKYSRIIT